MTITYLNYRICSVDGCFLKHDGMGFCKKHYSKLYESYDKRKEYHKEYNIKPVNKQRKLEWNRSNTDKTRQYRQKQMNKPDHKAKRKVYRQRPHVIEYERNYNKERYKKHPEKFLKNKIDRITRLGSSFDYDFNKMIWELNSWSKTVRNRDEHKCKICDNNAIHSHHIFQKKFYPKLCLNVNNGISLCYKCHREVHKFDY